MKVVNITKVMIKLQFKLPQALISRGFTRRTVFHAPAFQQKGINRLMDILLSTSEDCIGNTALSLHRSH